MVCITLFELANRKSPRELEPIITVLEKVVDAEVKFESWTIMHRCNLCHDICSEFPVSGVDKDLFAGFLYVWFRYSQLRQLDWQRRYNTTPRLVASALERLTLKLTHMFIHDYKDDSWCKFVVRQSLTCLGRGGDGGAGQAIRDEILRIMHSHNIKETAGHFYEQWHQKLHNNATPDDIVICKAVIAYLRSNGDMNVYDRELQKGGLTKVRMSKYERAITTLPFLHGNHQALADSFASYLKILENIFESAELRTSAAHCRGFLGPDGCRFLDQYLTSKSLQDLFNLRAILASKTANCSNVNETRNLLYLDLALETEQRLILMDAKNIPNNFHDFLILFMSILKTLDSEFGSDPEFSACTRDMIAFGEQNDKCNPLLLKAVCDRLGRWVGSLTDKYSEKVGVSAKYFGAQIKAEPELINTFTEESLRASTLFTLSTMLKKLDDYLRGMSNLPPWQIISSGSAKLVFTNIVYVPALIDHQTKNFPNNTILLTDKVSGEEEIPEGVAAVIVLDGGKYCPDILSHISVRCRNEKVFLSACYDVDLSLRLKTRLMSCGKAIKLNLVEGGSNIVFIEVIENEPIITNPISSSLKNSKQKTNKKSKKGLPSPAVRSSDPISTIQISSFKIFFTDRQDVGPMKSSDILDKYLEDVVLAGGKTMKLALLRNKLMNNKTEFVVPEGITLPFGTFQSVLSENLIIRETLVDLMTKLDETNCNETFKESQTLVDQLKMPEKLAHDLLDCAKSTDSLLNFITSESDLSDVWAAIKKVWRSIFASRPYIALKKASIPFTRIDMAVLLQETVRPDFAFVAHTRDPTSQNDGLMLIELVSGLGEVLVGSHPGRALAAVISNNADSIDNNHSNGFKVISYPSKSVALFPARDGLICRSDSNSEDLDGFAGAGLFESHPVYDPIPSVICYSDKNEKISNILKDESAMRSIFMLIAKCAIQVKNLLGDDHQDIEGVVKNNKIHIVQSRPQV